MKIAVSAMGGTAEAQVDSRFGRCGYFVFYDSETEEFESTVNESQSAGGGAGVSAAQTVEKHGAKMVLTGNVGPNAARALQAADIQFVIGVSGTVREAINRYKAGELTSVEKPNVEGHFGLQNKKE